MTRCSRTAERRKARSFALAALQVALGAGCAGPAFREHGPRELEPGGGGPSALERRAWERPRIQVAPAEVLAGSPTPYLVLGHEAGAGEWTLRLGPEAGEPVVVRYRVADGLRLPIAAGERLWFNQSSRGIGLVVREADGAPRVVVSTDGALTEAVEGILAPSFETDRLVYSELTVLPSGCVVALEHHELEVRRDGQRSFVTPGSVVRVNVPSPAGEIAMNLYVIDVSRPPPRRQERDDPRCEQPAHVSWMLVRAP
jgi:hypothetical protein